MLLGDEWCEGSKHAVRRINMLTADEIQTLLSDLENDRVERTVSTKKTDKFAEAVCAFANDMPKHGQPGFLIVGVEDDGTLARIEITDELLLRLGGLRADGNIQPIPTIRVAKVALPGGDVAVVEVQPSDFPPVRYKGRVCIRVGPRSGYASEQEERILSERRSVLVATGDVKPVASAPLKELSLRLFSDYRQQVLPPDVIESNHRTVEEQLAALRFFDLRRNVATVAGIVVIGTNPRYHLPGAYVQFLKLPGTALTDLPADQTEIDGDLATVVRELYARVQSNNGVAMATAQEFKDNLRPDYPEWSLRELLLNAVIHRDYESTAPLRFHWFADRIEIQNPGGLFAGVTRETLTKRSAYRNPTIAEAMKGLGYVNKFGFGIQRAQKLLADNGNPPLHFEIDESGFTVTVSKRAL